MIMLFKLCRKLVSRRSVALALIFTTCARPASTEPLAIICSLNKIDTTFLVDQSNGTVTTSAGSTSGQMQKYPAKITDRVIQFSKGPTEFTIDRYSGTISWMVGTSGGPRQMTWPCSVSHGPKF
jgi:hypothetical protein